MGKFENSDLKNMLLPGVPFGLLVTGPKGSGKSRLVFEAIKDQPHFLLLPQLEDRLQPAFWNEHCEKANNGYLVIENLERMSLVNQRVLFEVLVTGAKGKMGFGEKKYNFQPIVICNHDLSFLKSNPEMFFPALIDRISQLINILPSISELTEAKLWQKFIEVWKVFKFETPKPSDSLKKWLFEHRESFHGNFRDLETLVIRHDYLSRNAQKGIIPHENVPDEFKRLNNKLGFSTISTKSRFDFTIQFEEGKDGKYKNIMNNFKKELKAQAISHYGSIEKATKNLGVSRKTLERWERE